MSSFAAALCRVGRRHSELSWAVKATRETSRLSSMVRAILLLVIVILPSWGRQSRAADDVPTGGDSIEGFYFGPITDAYAPPSSELSPSSGLDEVAMSNFAEPSPSGQTGSYLTDRVGYNRLIDKVTDPTSYLMELRYRHQWNWPELGDDTQALQIRPTIPFRAWGQVNVLRVSVPYNIEGSGAPGLGDLQILDLVVYQQSWGRWGVGPSLQLTPHSATGDGEFQAGPAAGVVSKNKHWTVGFLTQNYFADNVGQSRLQPILSYKFNESWAVGIGDSEFRYDWENATWTQLPLGVELDYITKIFGQKAQFFVNPQYNFQQEASNSDWTLFLGLTLLFPEA